MISPPFSASCGGTKLFPKTSPCGSRSRRPRRRTLGYASSSPTRSSKPLWPAPMSTPNCTPWPSYRERSAECARVICTHGTGRMSTQRGGSTPTYLAQRRRRRIGWRCRACSCPCCKRGGIVTAGRYPDRFFRFDGAARAGQRKGGGRSYARALRDALWQAGIVRPTPGFQEAISDERRRALCLIQAGSEDNRPLDFHSFRRAYNTALADAGVNVQTAMRLAGHRNASTHMRYVMLAERLEAPEAALPRLLPSAAPKFKTPDSVTVGIPCAPRRIRTFDLRLRRPQWPSTDAPPGGFHAGSAVRGEGASDGVGAERQSQRRFPNQRRSTRLSLMPALPSR
jgi:hypothetical protein